MKVVVTGANGFVGAHVVRALMSRGDDVYAAVRPTSNCRHLAGSREPTWLEADFTDDEGRKRIAAAGADVCVHAAWYAEPGKYLASPTNVDLMAGTLHLAEELARSGCRRFVGVGTCFEYDTEAGYLSERTPLAPAHLYSAAKAGTYLALRHLGDAASMQVAWARLFYLYGPDEHPARLVPSVARALLRGEPARCTPGAQVRDFLHVEDVGSALASIAHNDVCGAVNIGSGQPVTVAALVQTLGELSGRPELVQLGALPYGPRDPMFVCADVRKLHSSTEWRPRWSLREGLANTLAWWRLSAS
jgi:nucleoside-diphosphate-sugar epimerase